MNLNWDAGMLHGSVWKHKHIRKINPVSAFVNVLSQSEPKVAEILFQYVPTATVFYWFGTIFQSKGYFFKSL